MYGEKIMFVYKHPETKEIKLVKFPHRWFWIPFWCGIELIIQDKFGKGLIALIFPIVALIFAFQYKTILSEIYREDGFELV